MADARHKILVLTRSSELLGRAGIAIAASGEPIDIVHTSRLKDAKELMAEEHIDLIVCDSRTGDVDHGEIMVLARSVTPEIPVVAVAQTPGYGDPVAVMRAGMATLAYVELPGHLALVVKREIAIANALKKGAPPASPKPEPESESESELEQKTEAKTAPKTEPIQKSEISKPEPLDDEPPRMAGMESRRDLLERVERKPKASLLVMRIDRFSNVVETLGMSGGEDALKQLAGFLKKHLGPSDFAARIEGTAFGILLAGDKHDKAEHWAGAVCAKIAETFFESGSRSTLMTVSIGICHDVDEKQDAFQDAWQAMRNAFEAGGNQFVKDAPGSGARQPEQKVSDAQWATRLNAALRNNGFRLAFQPIASLDGEHHDIYDVLLRLQDIPDETVMPNDFLPSAARSGLTVGIDRWVIGNALRLLSKPGKPGRGSSLFVRLSDQSLEHGGLLDWLGKLVAGISKMPGRVAIELQEKQVDSHMKQVMELSAGLTKLGCGMVIANFGSGNHSMVLLKQLQLDYIKLDVPLLEGVKGSNTKRDAIKEIIELAGSRSIKTIASGIEDANTMALLWQLGIGYIQGHYVQEPDVIVID